MSLSDRVLYFTGEMDSLDVRTPARPLSYVGYSICCQPATRTRNS